MNTKGENTMAGQAANCSREEVRSKIKSVECGMTKGSGPKENTDLKKTTKKK